MDNQDQGKNHSSGHESHGVHLCNKCGWPFPNPHPSAKHRRAHKKICGTIEGYKLVDSGDNISHSTPSDDEPLSDEDHKTPIDQVPKVIESSSFEKSIGGIGAMSNRSEYEVFSDAATEFQDTGFGLGRQDSMDYASKEGKIAEKDLTSTISFNDCEDVLESPQNSADITQKENPVLKVMPVLSTGTPEHQDLSLSYNKDSEDRIVPASDVVSTETETLMGVSEESRVVIAGDRLAECSAGKETETSEIEEGKLNKNPSGGLILPNAHAGEIPEKVSMAENRLDVTSDMALTDDLKEEFSDSFASKMSMSANGEQETDEKGKLRDAVAPNSKNASVTSKKTEDITSETGLAEKIVELEEVSNILAPNMVIHELSPNAESAKDVDVSRETFQIQTDVPQSTYLAAAVNSYEVSENKEKESESVYVLSVPDDIPVVDNAEIKLEGFKDPKRLKFPQLEALACEEITIDKKDEVRDCVSHEKSDVLQLNELDEDIKEDTSCMLVTEDSRKVDESNEAMVKEVVVEGKTDMLSPVAVDTTKNEKDQKVFSLEEQQPVCVSDDSHQTGFSGSTLNVLPDVRPMFAHAVVEGSKLNNGVGSDDMGIPEKSGSEVVDIAGGDNISRIDDENYVKNAATSCESSNNSSLSQSNSASNLPEVDNSDDIGTRKTEKSDTSVVESGCAQEEGNVSIKTNSTSESISTHHQFLVVTEEVNDSAAPDFRRASMSQDDIKTSVASRDNKVEGEYASKDLMASALDKNGGNEFEKTSEDQLKILHAPSYPEPTSQISRAVDDSNTRESGVNALVTSTAILQGEADNGPVKTQLDTTLADVSIESSSQTDSMEGHWGSVSVLSTQSDNPAVIDAENLPSTGSHALSEAEKADIKKPKVVSEEKHSDKSDEFEPPSFMTLVEPRGGDQKASATEIQTVENAQNPRAAHLQAGWFPSLTHVANESEGRKKNEEIIAKVTNWNAKQHTPLKNLLGDANNETKPKSPKSKESPTIVIPREEKAVKDNGTSITKVSSILGPETPVAEATNTEVGKEWNSPARYPADIKREKRKVKGRPLWVQFVCCSSVN